MVLQSCYAIIAFVMSYLIFSGRVEVWHVIVASAITGIVFAFDMPTRQALMINLVDKEHFASALSLNGAIFNAARVVGPAIAGALIAAAGIAPAYLFNGVSFLAVIVSVWMMRLPIHPKRTEHPPFRGQLAEGFRFVRQTPVVFVSLTLVAILTIFTWPVNTLMAVFAHDIYNRGEVGFGLLQSAFGLGAMVGAFGFHALYEKVRRKNRLLLSCVFVIFFSTMTYALWHQFILSLLMLFFSGWSVATMIGILNTVVQESVPDRLRGRILSYYSFVLVGGMPFGALLASLGVGIISAPLTIALCALLFGLASVVILYSTRDTFLTKLI